jgi:hypothetical protein
MSDELDDLLPKSRECGRPAIGHVCEIRHDTGETESFHLCEEHGRQYFEKALSNGPVVGSFEKRI